MKNGSTVLMTTNTLRLSSHLLPTILFNSTKSSVTIIQMTPSLFQKWTLNEINKIMNPDCSSLRCLILGGEVFPSTRIISKWQNWSSARRKRLFNIYGLTEISCWSSIYEITKRDIENESIEIPIGEPLDDDIKFYVKNSHSNGFIEQGQGVLLIESQHRQCIIENVWPTFQKRIQFTTEDIVEITEKRNLIFIGRSNDVIKRYGKQISLKNIENRAVTCHGVENACCIYDNESHSLILFVCSNGEHPNEEELQHFFKTNGPTYEIPDKIMPLQEFPLSQHGKISKSDLLSRHKEMISDYFPQNIPKPDQMFSLKLNYFLGINGKSTEWICTPEKKQKTELDLSFVEHGGTSFLALNLSSQMDYIFGVHFDQLMPQLLDRNVSIKSILQYLNEFKLSGSKMDNGDDGK